MGARSLCRRSKRRLGADPDFSLAERPAAPAAARPVTTSQAAGAKETIDAGSACRRDRRAPSSRRRRMVLACRKALRLRFPYLRAAAHLSVVVLPFTNLSGDPAQDYFADGITDNLTTDLSRIRDSFVIARNTAFTYKGKSDRRQGDRQGTRRSLRPRRLSAARGNRVRVNAQLIDAETGAHIWVDRFEEDVADLFKLQDQVVARLANALNYELVRAEAETSARSKNPDVIDLDMRGNEALWRFQAATDEGRASLPFEPCSNRRSRSTPTTPMRWAATPLPI